jgi:hypothetical protein
MNGKIIDDIGIISIAITMLIGFLGFLGMVITGEEWPMIPFFLLAVVYIIFGIVFLLYVCLYLIYFGIKSIKEEMQT